MKKYWLPCLLLLLSIIFFAVAALSPSYLDADGVLVEPGFFGIPLGYLTLALAGVSLLILKISRRKK
ncbi:DUF3955 domain-containing protein [Enterococcus nangangensis]|uniref:DUF3955 domain-containing protein n=1 Tax=Enterococcus nangangensis TaxID=2559926 RepID=UPI0010F676E6|nr:DUF3955 domain-containing protein [Enterococcus nangangensis]